MMSDAGVAALGLLAAEVVLLAVFAWMPLMRGERAFFGVRVSAETYRGEGRRVLRRYWQTLAAVFVLLGGVSYYSTVRTGQPLFAAGASVAATAAAVLVYTAYARRMRPFAVSGTETRFASSVRERRPEDYATAWLEAAVVVLTCATFALLAHFYPQMPALIPVHWNLAGEPDDWARKSFSTIFFLPCLGAYMQTCFYVLKRDLAHAKMTLPATGAEEYLRGKERYLKANVRLTEWASACVAALFLDISLLLVSTSVPALNRFTAAAGVGIWVVVALLLAGILYFLVRMSAANAELEEKFGDVYVQRAAEEGHWRHGGLTYHNPDDPALVVEKLVGLGYTLNMAHPAVRWRLLLLAGIPVFVVWAFLSL